MCLLLWIKCLKYLSWFGQLRILGETFMKAATYILAFIVIFIVILTGFVIAFYFQFGESQIQFKSITVSLVTLMRGLVGDFDFERCGNGARDAVDSGDDEIEGREAYEKDDM